MSIGTRNEKLLSADFAARVVTRVQRHRHKRQINRALVILGTAGAIVWMFFLAAQIPSVQTAGSNAAQPSQPMTVRLSAQNLGAYDAPLSNFFPGALTVARFQWSETGYWHSYDPWWNLPSTDGF
jgi:predicted PurR-regulated permease PerM